MSQPDCLFCTTDDPVLSNALIVARDDDFGVSDGQLLLPPCRHVENDFDLPPAGKQIMWPLFDEAQVLLDQHKAPGGYNVGSNCGSAAGQSVLRVHLHQIPRHSGDVKTRALACALLIPPNRYTMTRSNPKAESLL